MVKKRHHVISNPKKDLDIESNCSTRTIIHTTTKATAVEQGRILGKTKSTEFIIY